MPRTPWFALLPLIVGLVLPDSLAANGPSHRSQAKPHSSASGHKTEPPSAAHPSGQAAQHPPRPATVQLPPIYRRAALRHLARKPFAQEHLLPRRAPVIRMPLRTPLSPPMTLDPWKIRVIDGDTFAYGADRIRLREIDTPEKDQAGGFEATQRLDSLLHEGTVTMVTDVLDIYGRTLADVYVDSRNVADVLRREGYAKPRSR